MRRKTTTPATMTLRLLSLGLAVGATACQTSPARAERPAAAVEATSAPAAATPVQAAPAEEVRLERTPFDPHALAAADGPNDLSPLQRVPAAEQSTQTPAAQPAKQKASPATPRPPKPIAVRVPGDPMSATSIAYNTFARSFRRGGDPVAIVGAEPMEPSIADAWREDLVVMDKLLRDAVSAGAASYREIQPRVLGLDIKMNDTRVSPTYVEGAGVILTAGVGFPLQPGERASTQPERPRQRPSAWERAKRDVSGGGGGSSGSNYALGKFDESRIAWVGEGEMPFEAAPAVEYDQAQVDTLVDAIVKTLPEASNFRHLKEDEFVFVTIVGYGETGAPVRLTLKAKKADIDAAAKGTMTPEQFKTRVASRLTAGSQPSRPDAAAAPSSSLKAKPTKVDGK